MYKSIFASICMLLMLSSCNSSKIAFGNSYYFKQTPKKVVEKAAAIPAISASGLTASLNTGTLSSRTPVAIPQPLAEAALRYESVAKELEREDLSRTEKKALKSEKRVQKKVFKKELKKFAKAQKQAGVAQVDPDDDINGLVKAGIIVGAAGLVMLLIGVLASVSFLTALGGIFLAVGVVLILLKIL